MSRSTSARDAAPDAVENEGKTVVYLEHLVRLVQPLVERGYEVQVWGDILREDPALAQKMLPDGVVAVPWHYEQPWPDELLAQVPQQARDTLAQLDVNPAAGFRPHVEPLADLAMPYWIAPGTATWNSLIGRVDNAVGNLRDAAAARPRVRRRRLPHHRLGRQRTPPAALRELGAARLRRCGELVPSRRTTTWTSPPSLDTHVFGDTAGILGGDARSARA